MIEAGTSWNSVGLTVAPHEALIGYIRYISQKYLIGWGLFFIVAFPVPLILFLAFNGRGRYFRSRLRYFLCTFAITLWLVFVTFNVVRWVFTAEEEFDSLRRDDCIALVTVCNWAVVALVGIQVRRRWNRMHASAAT